MKTNQHNSLDDIVFENKNKAYGAYYNRLTAGFDLMKSLFITIFGIGILAIILSFTIEEKVTTPETPDRVVPFGPSVLPDDKKVKPVEKEKPVEKQKTIQSDKTNKIPTPTVDPKEQSSVLDNDDIATPVSPEGNPDGADNIMNTDGNTDSADGGDNGNAGGAEEPVKENNTIYNARQVTEMAVFPGCEKFAGNKEKLTSCMSEQLQRELGSQLSDFEATAERQGINEAIAKVQFVIDKSGKIVEVKTINGGNVELSKESKEALERISKKMVQKGKYIKPAKFDDGTPVNLIFTIPVKFISN